MGCDSAHGGQSLACATGVSFLWAGPPTVSVLPEGPVHVKVGKSVTLECVSAGEPRSSAHWTRIGTPTHLEQQMYGVMDSHTVLQVRRVFSWSEVRAISSLSLRPSQGSSLNRCLEERMVNGQMGDEWMERERRA